MASCPPVDRLRASSWIEDAMRRVLLCVAMIGIPLALRAEGPTLPRIAPDAHAAWKVSFDPSRWTIDVPTFAPAKRAPDAAKMRERECVRMRPGEGRRPPAKPARILDVYGLIRAAVSAGAFRAGRVCRVVFYRGHPGGAPRAHARAHSGISSPPASVIRN
jgi:hypothetical protein